jgi:PhzF family phenazine biosynthesis protein
MHGLEILQVDAFTTVPFAGNPAGVVLQADGLDARTMQSIANEMALAETAFLSAPTTSDSDLRLRWFTPQREVAFCGHATIAALHALREAGRCTTDRIVFETLGGPLPVAIDPGTDPILWLEPALPTCRPFGGVLTEILACLGMNGCAPWARVVLTGEGDVLVPAESLAALRRISPDLHGLGRVARAADLRGIAVVAREGADAGTLTHTRFFAPHYGVPEDVVTGSVHAAIPVWLWAAGALRAPGGVARFTAEQGDVLGRPGRLAIELHVAGGEPRRVRVGGRAGTVLRGTLRC